MTRLLTTLAICLASMVMISDQVKAATPPEVKTAFFQPRPGGVLDVVTSPFRALTQPVSYNRYQPYYGRSAYPNTNCVNGRCYTNSYYRSPCVNGNCRTGCTTGNCSTGYGNQHCPGGNCGNVRYLSPAQNYSGYRGNTQQYHSVSQPVYKPYVPTNSMRNDPFFP